MSDLRKQIEEVKTLVFLENLGHALENDEVKNVEDINWGVILDAVDLLKEKLGIDKDS
jgi:ribosome assembly protein YihI (activator of Der GTPase)